MLESIKPLIKENFGAFMTASAAVFVGILTFIGVLWQNRKKKSTAATPIKQTSKGSNVTMIGIQNNTYQSAGEDKQCAKK